MSYWLSHQCGPRQAVLMKHYNCHEGWIYCRTVVLDCISFNLMYLINWQLSVCGRLPAASYCFFMSFPADSPPVFLCNHPVCQSHYLLNSVFLKRRLWSNVCLRVCIHIRREVTLACNMNLVFFGWQCSCWNIHIMVLVGTGGSEETGSVTYKHVQFYTAAVKLLYCSTTKTKTKKATSAIFKK